MTLEAFSMWKRYAGIFFSALIFLSFFGCATAPPMPVTIKHERAPQNYAAQPKAPAPAEQSAAKAATGTTAPGGPATKPVEEKVTETELPKNVPSNEIAEEVKKNLHEEVKKKVHEELPEKMQARNQEEIEKIAASVAEKLKKGIQDQIKDQIHEELVREEKERENERIEKITANVVAEFRKELQERARKQVWAEMPEDIKENRQEQVEQATAAISEEVMKEMQAEVRKRVREELPRGTEVNEKEIEKAAANIDEKLKKSVMEEVVSEVQEELPSQVQEGEKEQIKKITENVDEELKSSLHDQIKNEVSQELPKEETKKADMMAALPEWIRRFSFSGDMRLRYEHDGFDQNNAAFAQPSNPTQLMNTTVDQNLYKYRVRFGVDAKVNDELHAVARLSTGNTSNPISTNSILGTYFNKDNVLFDQAYLRYQPLDFLTFWGGRIPNPWFYTDLVWSRDLNFEGLAFNLRRPVTESWGSYLTGGAFPLQQNNFASRSKWLFGGQLGMEKKSQDEIAANIAAAYYYYLNITGVQNTPQNPDANDWTAPLFQQKGNTLFNISANPSTILTALASEFHELDLTGSLDIGFWDPWHVVFVGDYVKNFGFNTNDVAQRTGIPNPNKDTDAYKVGMSVGQPVVEKFGQWRAYFSYRKIGADAVVDAFNDPDFHLGGTNAKGWELGGDFGLLKNCWLTLRWLTADQVSGPPLAIDVLQVDINAKF
jgi:hypothetical protein